MNTRTLVALIATTMVLVTGCSIGNIGPTGNTSLENTEWVLSMLNGHPPLPDTMPTVTFSQGRIGGSTGCNSYSGSYETRGSSLTIKDTAVTEMYCMDPAGVMDQEQAFLSALGQVQSYRLTDGRLEMLDAAGNVILVLVPT